MFEIKDSDKEVVIVPRLLLFTLKEDGTGFEVIENKIEVKIDVHSTPNKKEFVIDLVNEMITDLAVSRAKVALPDYYPVNIVTSREGDTIRLDYLLLNRELPPGYMYNRCARLAVMTEYNNYV